MIYNAIQMREAVDKLIDRVKSPRFNDANYYTAINRAIDFIVKDRVENIKKKKNYSFQSSQRLRDELYTLVMPTFSPIPTGNTIAFPADYKYLLAMGISVDNIETICRPITLNEKALMKRNPFKRPTTNKTYYTEDSSGWQIFIPSGGTITSIDLDYLKLPNVVTIGQENDKIASGVGVLTNATDYIVYEEAVHAGVTYYEGEVFTSSNTNLTSGIVILRATVIDSDMPESLHEEIITGAAAIMNGTVEDWQKQQSLKIDNQES